MKKVTDILTDKLSIILEVNVVDGEESIYTGKYEEKGSRPTVYECLDLTGDEDSKEVPFEEIPVDILETMDNLGDFFKCGLLPEEGDNISSFDGLVRRIDMVSHHILIEGEGEDEKAYLYYEVYLRFNKEDN